MEVGAETLRGAAAGDQEEVGDVEEGGAAKRVEAPSMECDLVRGET